MLKKKKHRQGNDYVEPDLPITPMLDMSFQLLAFFVTTYNPSPVEAMLPLALPKLDGGPQSTLALPTEDEAEELTVQIESTETGAIDGIRAFTKLTAANPTDLGKDVKKLQEFLKGKIAALKGAAPGKLTIEMGDELNYQSMITVIDISKRAGYDRVSPAPLNKKEKK